MDRTDTVFAGEFVVGYAANGIGSLLDGFFNEFIVFGAAIDTVLRESNNLDRNPIFDGITDFE